MPLHHVEAAVPETLGDGLGDGPGFYGQRCVHAPQAVDICLRYRCLLTRALHGSPERLAAVRLAIVPRKQQRVCCAS